MSDDMANRFNTGKPKLSRVLEFGPVIDGIARIMEFGDIKYGRYNWQKGLSHTEILDSLLRHALAWSDGQDRDPESGQHHTEHMVVNAMMLCYNQLVGVGIDDRCAADSPLVPITKNPTPSQASMYMPPGQHDPDKDITPEGWMEMTQALIRRAKPAQWD